MIKPCIAFKERAEEAVKLYTSIFPDSRVDRVTPLHSDSPSGPAGSVKVVDFTLFGQRFQAISAGPLDPFNHAISLVVICNDQAELDRYWDALLKGGKAEACEWLQDKYGVSWQIVPAVMDEMMSEGAEVDSAPDRGLCVDLDPALGETWAATSTATGSPLLTGEPIVPGTPPVRADRSR